MNYRDDLKLWKIQYWTAALNQHGGNVRKIARLAGVDRSWVHKQLVDLGIRETKRPAWDRPISNEMPINLRSRPRLINNTRRHDNQKIP